MKKWILRLSLILALVLIVSLVVVFFSLNTIVKRGVEKVGPIVTKTEVKLDAATLSPFSGKGEFHGLSVANPEGYKTPTAIKVGQMKVNLNLKSVLSDIVLVQTIEIDAPEITFEGGLGGNNLKKLLDNISSTADAADDSKTSTEKPPEGGKKLKVESIVIKNAKVHVSLTGIMGGKTKTVGISDITLTNIGMDENGVTSAELSQQIIRHVLIEVIKVIPKVAGDLGGNFKEFGGDALQGAEKSVKGLKGLFKK